MSSLDRVVASSDQKFGLEIPQAASAGTQLPVEATAQDAELMASLKPFTMTSGERPGSLMNAVCHVSNNRVPGDFVECGLWCWGSVMAMTKELSPLGVSDRQIWLYDTFAGMTAPIDEDAEAGSGVTAENMLDQTVVRDDDKVWCVAGLPGVQTNTYSTRCLKDKFTFVEGDAAQILSFLLPVSISLLRLDMDWCESTRMELKVLYPRLSVGGVCIFDDSGHWQGARKAVDEYFEKIGHRPYMHPIDYSGRVLIKTEPYPESAG